MPGGGWFSYTLRQLTFNPSNFNSLRRCAVQSIGTFVTQCVQQPFELGLLGTIRLERHPRHLKTDNSFKRPLKGLLVVFVLDACQPQGVSTCKAQPPYGLMILII